MDRGLFLCKRAIPDIQPTIVVLCTILKQPNQVDWKNLLRFMTYLVGTQELCLTLRSDKTSSLKWYVYLASAAHSDFKPHTGETLKMGKGVIIYVTGGN